MPISKCGVILHGCCFVGLNLILISEGLIWLELSNNGPAILNSTIDFFAELKGDSLKNNYTYKFQLLQQESVEKYCGVNCTYSIQLSTPQYTQGSFIMKVIVSETDVRKEVVSNETSFNVTDTINGGIKIFKEGNVELKSFVPSGKPLNLTAYIHDPNDFFHNATMSYMWKINRESQSNVPVMQHTFNKTGQSNIVLVVLADFPKSEQEAKWGIFEKYLTVEDEIPKINITGENWILHGRMLNLHATCNGSSPFHYCWDIYLGDKPKANFTCQYPLSSDSCNFMIKHYIPTTGQYYISVLVKNDVSTVTRSMDIRIIDTSHVPQLSVIVIPITCVILAIIIVVAGIGYYLHQRKQYVIEVADFNFTQTEELTEMTFFERVCNAIKNNFANVRPPQDNSRNYRRLRTNYGSVVNETSSNHTEPHVC